MLDTVEPRDYVARDFDPKIGRAVADRTVARLVERRFDGVVPVDVVLPRNDEVSLHAQVNAYAASKNYIISGFHVTSGDDLSVEATLYVVGEKRRENWGEVAARVSLGNAALSHGDFKEEYATMRRHMAKGTLLMSGRHLQHGDESQSKRPGEVFTNCGHNDTEVITLEKGVVRLGEVVGETLTVRCSDGEWREATFNEHGEQRLYELTFVGLNGRGERKVKFTRNHRWILEDGTVTTDIQPGDVLMPAPEHKTYDPDAVVHGLVFGDGTAHKGRRDHGRPGVSQGRTYASIRVCKQDAVRDEIHAILDKAGYRYKTPPHAKGDRVYYIGKFAHAKELPFTRDPDYVAGFIYGWWLADGHKTEHCGKTISTADEEAAEWLLENAVIAGQTVVSHVKKGRKEGDGSFPNGKALHCVRMRSGTRFKLSEIKPLNVEKVYCPEEPITQSFVLANGLLTGNCATAPATFILFYLLLNGSGVGRDYSDVSIPVDLRNMPIVVPVIEWSHADVAAGRVQARTRAEVEHLYADRKITTFVVPDSREGWAEAISVIETMAFEERRDEVLILDFTQVRPHNAPIAGMQGRPASGPAPLMSAIENIAKLRDAGMQPWRAALYADHFLAEVVLVGGARRAARMSTKWWKDPGVLDFIKVKRGGQFLWSSNNSVTVDKEFWDRVRIAKAVKNGVIHEPLTEMDAWAETVYDAVCKAAYFDQTGEPGFINVDKFKHNLDWMTFDKHIDAAVAGVGKRLNFWTGTDTMLRNQMFSASKLPYPMITNPCGEIQLATWGGYCVIADLAWLFADSLDDAEQATRAAVRALIRTNLMSFLFDAEVKRTNRIGVGPTGIFEFALVHFGFGFRDLLDEKKSMAFWKTIERFSRAAEDEAAKYSTKLGVKMPHTITTAKPSGTISKLFGLSEGVHLPAMREYIRWVQFRHDDPLVEDYKAKGYPTRELRTYKGTVIIGFPTKPKIVELAEQLGLEDKVVTAPEATPAEQFQWLKLLEKYWLRGGEEFCDDYGNQLSYTLKYYPDKVSFAEFGDMIMEHLPQIKCVSVMPSVNETAYEYTPEQGVSKAEFEKILAAINGEKMEESIDREHIDCGTGACPIDFQKTGV